MSKLTKLQNSLNPANTTAAGQRLTGTRLKKFLGPNPFLGYRSTNTSSKNPSFWWCTVYLYMPNAAASTARIRSGNYNLCYFSSFSQFSHISFPEWSAPKLRHHCGAKSWFWNLKGYYPVYSSANLSKMFWLTLKKLYHFKVPNTVK